MGAGTFGASRGLRFLAILGIASASQISRASLSDGHTLVAGIGFGAVRDTLRYSIPFLPKEVTEEWRGAILDGCDALIQVGVSWGSTSIGDHGGTRKM